jgi:hypothetical protein
MICILPPEIHLKSELVSRNVSLLVVKNLVDSYLGGGCACYVFLKDVLGKEMEVELVSDQTFLCNSCVMSKGQWDI